MKLQKSNEVKENPAQSLENQQLCGLFFGGATRNRTGDEGFADLMAEL